jgi:hypothetical protein
VFKFFECVQLHLKEHPFLGSSRAIAALHSLIEELVEIYEFFVIST